MSDAELDKSSNSPQDDSAVNAETPANESADADSSSVVFESDPAALAEELDRANDRVLRAQAELENFRKRSRRELDDQRRYANLPLLGDLLPVLDNLDRAVEAAEQNDATSGLLEGVKMVSMQLLTVLEKHGCRPIEADGVAFDPNLHEAIGKELSAEADEGQVTRVTRVGYQLFDRVVRPSQVLISGGPPAATSDAASDA